MEKFMAEALKEAEKARGEGEVPVGCVIEKDGKIVGRGHNRIITEKDPTAHAEIQAIRMAAEATGRERLEGCRMYVTLEPCSMCAGAIVLARIEELIIGADDIKTGACGSVLNIVEEPRLNHRVDITRGVMKDECEKILKDFFQRLRRRSGGNNR